MRQRRVKNGVDCLIHKDAIFRTELYLISLGNHIWITLGVKFIMDDGGLRVTRNMGLIDERADKFGKIVIRNNVIIEWDAKIMPGVTIGDSYIIGAGAVVTKEIPANSVAVGVPARLIETIEEYTEKN